MPSPLSPAVFPIVLASLVACGGSPVAPPAGAPESDAGSPGPVSGDAGDSSSPSSPTDSGAADAGPIAPSDSGSPASHAPLPQFPYGPSAGAPGTASPLLGAVEIVTATWPKAPTSDPLSAQLSAFGAAIAQGSWWDGVRAGYCGPTASTCVGKGGPAVAHGVGDTPNPAITDTVFAATGSWSFKKFINDKTTAGDLPTPDANTLYVFFLPPGFSVTLDGAPTCGYHSVATVNVNGVGTANIPYVVIPRCQVTGTSDLDVATTAASREIIEAVTDPYLAQGETGFYLSDPAWSPTGNEVGDYCVGQSTTEAGSTVQRVWSNERAAGSHDPCVPAPSGEVYYNVAPATNVADGITLAVGASVTFAATAFSDGATSAWKLQAQELSPSGAGVLVVSFDRTTVSNGDAVNVTVKLTGKPAATVGGKSFARFAIVSSGSDGQSHAWPVIVYAE